MPPRFKTPHSVRRPGRHKRGARQPGPVFVFVMSSTIAALFGHVALLAFEQLHDGTDWKASTSPELVRGSVDDAQRVAMNGER